MSRVYKANRFGCDIVALVEGVFVVCGVLGGVGGLYIVFVVYLLSYFV